MKYLILLVFIVPVSVLGNITCPDGTKCEDGGTCCPMEEGGYGCCKYSNAVCCSDDQCCPATTICIAIFHTCVGIAPGSNGPQLLLTPSRPKTRALSAGKPKEIPCPGAWGSCPDNTTCCPTGCCLEPDAVCCADGKHCCPKGFSCDIKRQKCVTNSSFKKRIHKKKMINIEIQSSLQTKTLSTAYSVSTGLRNVVCPGGEYFCADMNTCCLSKTGDWKCCPLLQASCCEDGEHCCPAGTTCSKGGRFCTVTSNSNRTSKKSPSLPFL